MHYTNIVHVYKVYKWTTHNATCISKKVIVPIGWNIISLHRISNDINRHMAFLGIYFAVSVLITSRSAHANCMPGLFSGVYGCEPCPKGTYKVDTGPGPCTHCFGWLTTNKTGSTSSNDCFQPCSEGQYINNDFQCQPCPENTYRNTLMEKCATCDDGLVTVRKGATAISECVPCKRGTYRHWILCIKCPDNNTNTCCKRSVTKPFVTKRSCDQDCPTGHPNFTWSDFCQPCPLNTYKVEGEINCKPCLNGTVTKIVGADNVSYCQETVEAASADQYNTEHNLAVNAVLIVLVVLTILFFGIHILLASLRKGNSCTDKCHNDKNQFSNNYSSGYKDEGNVGDDASVTDPLNDPTNSSNKSSDAAKVNDTYDHLPFVKHKTTTMQTINSNCTVDETSV